MLIFALHDAPDTVRAAGLLADPARARILGALIDGTTRPAGELAYVAKLSAQAVGAHLAKLVEGGLLVAEVQGRHRYFRIASAAASAIDQCLSSLAESCRPRPARAPLPAPGVPMQFLRARTCYGHLAGEKAVRVLHAMVQARWLSVEGRDFSVTRLGEKKLEVMGIDLAATRRPRRTFARACVDLTERRAHLGGALGAALLDLYVSRGWVERHRRSRVVTITSEGHANLARVFGIEPAPATATMRRTT